MKITAVTLSILFLIGCASTSPTARVITPTREDQIFSHGKKTSDEDVPITIIRNTGIWGTGCRVGFFIDGERAGDIIHGDIATFYLSPGQHRLGIGESKGRFCRFGNKDIRIQRFDIKTGEPRNFSIMIEYDMPQLYEIEPEK